MRYPATGPQSSNLNVVFAHGAGAGQRHPFITGIARRLAEAGIDVWTFNFLYMEQKRRAPDKAAALEQCFRRSWNSCRNRPGSARRLVIGGKSMGGRIATHLAAQGDRLDGVFALGYPLHPPGKPEQLRSAHLPDIAVPVLIVQGERDAFGTPDELTPVIADDEGPGHASTVVTGGDHSLGARGRPRRTTLRMDGEAIAAWTKSFGRFVIHDRVRGSNSGPVESARSQTLRTPEHPNCSLFGVRLMQVDRRPCGRESAG